MAIQLSQELRNFISDAKDGNIYGLVIDDRTGLELQGLMIAWILSTDSVIQFFDINGPSSDNAYAGPKEGTDAIVGVTSGSGILNPFNNNTTVEVVVTGGGATNPMLNGAASPCLVTLVDGLATVSVSADTVGTVLLGLANGNSTLDRSDTATVTLS